MIGEGLSLNLRLALDDIEQAKKQIENALPLLVERLQYEINQYEERIEELEKKLSQCQSNLAEQTSDHIMMEYLAENTVEITEEWLLEEVKNRMRTGSLWFRNEIQKL